MKNKLNSLESYFNSRAEASANSCYVNGYSNRSEESVEFYDSVVEELNQLAPLHQATTLLEIGCGNGELLSKLSSRVQKAKGIDISEKMVTLAKNKNMDVVHYDGNQLPFENASFDVVILYSVLINIPSKKMAKLLIMEASRVLRPQGCLILGAVPDPQQSKLPQHSNISLRSLYSRLRTMHDNVHSVGYFSYSPSFFLEIYRELNFLNITFSRCTLSRSGWSTKYHIMMEK